MSLDALIEFLFDLATALGSKLLGALLIFAVGSKGIQMFLNWLKTAPKLDRLDAGLRTFLVSFSRIILYVLLVITVAMVLGVPATSFITMLASCGVAIGLALQGSLSNFAGGLMILFFKPFKVGDYIDASGESGTVAEISVVYTVILTPDGKRVTIPNGGLTNSVIRNYSSEELRRVDLTFGAAYGCDVELVKNAIRSVVETHELVLKDPEPFVRLSSHDDSALTYTVRAWCRNSDYWTVHFDLMEGVKKAFDANGIEIPFPQIDVHMSK